MEHLIMSNKERKPLIVFERLKNREIKQNEAALQLKVSCRWIRKKFKRYIEQGERGLIHSNRGKPSKKRWNPNKRMLAMDLLRGDWHGFGPTFAAEKLKEYYNVTVSNEALRKAMIREGLWHSNF